MRGPVEERLRKMLGPVEERLRKLRRFCVLRTPEEYFPFNNHYILYMSQDLFDRWMWEVCLGDFEKERELRCLAKTGVELTFQLIPVVVSTELPPDTAQYWLKEKK